MQELKDYKHFASRVIFKLIGICPLVLFLLWNPVILRPRSWNAHVVARSMAFDTGLLVVGIGFIWLIRWAAFLSFALAEWGIFGVMGAPETRVALTLVFLVPLILTVVFWRNLVWGSRLRDLLLVLASIAVSAIVHYTAFLLRH